MANDDIVSSRQRRRARHRQIGLAPAIALGGLLFVLYAPLAQLVVASVNRNPLSTGWKGFTWGWFRDAFANPEVTASLGRSVRLAVVAGIVSVGVGTAVAIASRRQSWLRAVAQSLAGARVATPEIIIATALGVALPVASIRYGFTAMLLGHVVYLTAYVALLVGARAAGADPRQEEAALDLGAKPWQVLWTITLPDLFPAIASAGLLAAAFSFDDVALSSTLRGPRDTTLPVLIFSKVQRRVTPEIHAIGACVLAVGATLFLAATLVNTTLRQPVGTQTHAMTRGDGRSP